MVEALRKCSQREKTDPPSDSETGQCVIKGNTTLCSYLILFIEVPLKSVKVVLAVVATQVVGISLWLWIGVGDVWDVRVVGLLQVLVAGLAIL